MTRDDSYSPFAGISRRPPEPVLLEQCWSVIGPSQRAIACGIYEGAAGRVEARCYYAESIDALLRSELTYDLDVARPIAGAWKRAEIEKGFEEIQ
jgi:hypothetical protein